MGTTRSMRARSANAKTRFEQDHIAPLIAAGGSVLGNIFKKIDLGTLGKVTPGIVDLKLASGIKAAQSLGYSDEQIRQEPIYSVVAGVGSFPVKITTVVADASNILKRFARENGITLPPPELNAYTYVPLPGGTAAGGPTSAAIIAPIFGEGVAELSRTRQTITSLPPANAPGMTEPVSARIQNETQKRTQEPPSNGNVEILRPLIPVMNVGLEKVGQIPPQSLEAKAQAFYDRVVVPGSGETFALDEDVVEAILTFVAAKAAKTAAGEEQSDLYNKIGEATLRIESKLMEAGRTKVDQKIGGFLTSNLPLFLIAIVALFAFASMGKPAK